MNQKKENIVNLISSFVITICIVAILSVCFDFYYDLNDDVTIMNILSGAYLGVPDGHNLQQLYPLTWFISLLYKLLPAIPWYGYFLCGCNFLCMFLLGNKVQQVVNKRIHKMIILVFEQLLMLVLFLYEFVFVQYTVTSALLVGTAIALFLVNKESNGDSIGRFIKQNILVIFLAVLSFQIRTEMFLLVCPFICFAGLFAWVREKSFFKKGFIKVCFINRNYAGRLGCKLWY